VTTPPHGRRYANAEDDSLRRLVFAYATMVPSRSGMVCVLQDAGLHAHKDHVACAQASMHACPMAGPATPAKVFSNTRTAGQVHVCARQGCCMAGTRSPTTGTHCCIGLLYRTPSKQLINVPPLGQPHPSLQLQVQGPACHSHSAGAGAGQWTGLDACSKGAVTHSAPRKPDMVHTHCYQWAASRKCIAQCSMRGARTHSHPHTLECRPTPTDTPHRLPEMASISPCSNPHACHRCSMLYTAHTSGRLQLCSFHSTFQPKQPSPSC
jgi:hypothetical protein